MPKRKHPANRYERRLINKDKPRRSAPQAEGLKSKRRSKEMEEIRNLELWLNREQIQDLVMSHLDAVNLVQPDDQLLAFEMDWTSPTACVPIKLKYSKLVKAPEETGASA